MGRKKRKPSGFLRCLWCGWSWTTDVPRDGWDSCPHCRASFSFRKPVPEAEIIGRK